MNVMHIVLPHGRFKDAGLHVDKTRVRGGLVHVREKRVSGRRARPSTAHEHIRTFETDP